MRIAVTGCDGQLGQWLVRSLQRDPAGAPGATGKPWSDWELVGAFGHGDADFAEPQGLASLPDRCSRPPDVWINAAAFTAVDRCESEEALALRVNAESPGLLAEACRERGVRFVQVSTDFVFDGRARRPYNEDDPPHPLGAYGRTKLAGERSVLASHPEALVVRTSWVFGPGPNFVRTMLRLAEERASGRATGPLAVVADQRGRPTYSADLARAILGLVGASASGIVHFANDGEASWWELARAALDAAGYSSVPIEKIAARDYARAAPTPMYSVLDLGRVRALGIEPRPWRDALADYLASDDRPGRGEAGR
jgi:dTDP-4-dehydrorhamnose reductase